MAGRADRNTSDLPRPRRSEGARGAGQGDARPDLGRRHPTAPFADRQPLVIGEGIESSASAGRLMGLPAWAAVSAGNLAKGLVLPSEARRVVIAADPDDPVATPRVMLGCAGTPKAEPSRSPHPMARATSTTCCVRGRLAMSDADEFADRDPADEPPNEATSDAAVGSDGFTVTDTPPDPLDGLAERVKNDPGAPFKPDVLAALTQLRRTDRAAFETSTRPVETGRSARHCP